MGDLKKISFANLDALLGYGQDRTSALFLWKQNRSIVSECSCIGSFSTGIGV